MTSFENIEGPKLNAIFNRLASDRTFVKVSSARGAFESLTLVAQSPKENARQVFHIDPPVGLTEAVTKTNSSLLHFEFTSDDGITHQFDSEIKAITSEVVSLHFPPYIRRHQQRNNFRVKVLFESFAKVVIGDTELRLAIENLSVGGVFCYCMNKHKPIFEESQYLEGIEIVLTMHNECFVVPILKAQVNRIESTPRPKHFGIAFEFIRLKRASKKILVQQIYELQRQLLQSRLNFLG